MAHSGLIAPSNAAADLGSLRKEVKNINNAGADIYVLGTFIFSHSERRDLIAGLKSKLK